MGGGRHGGRSWAQTSVETAVGDVTCSRRSRGRRLLLCVRVREATRHGGAGDGECELEVRRKGRGQRPGLASRVTVRACWGARLREGVAARTSARERERECDANATRRERAGTARQRPRRGGFLRLEGLG
jgi:hypothetical protein